MMGGDATGTGGLMDKFTQTDPSIFSGGSSYEATDYSKGAYTPTDFGESTYKPTEYDPYSFDKPTLEK